MAAVKRSFLTDLGPASGMRGPGGAGRADRGGGECSPFVRGDGVFCSPSPPSRGPADDSRAGRGPPQRRTRRRTWPDDSRAGRGRGRRGRRRGRCPMIRTRGKRPWPTRGGARGHWTMIRMRGEGPWRGRRRRGSRAHAPGRAPREADEPLPRGPSAVPGPPVRCIARPTRASCRPPVGVVVPTLGQGLPAGRSVVGTCRPVSRRSGPPRARPAPPAPPAPARRASRPAGRPPR